MTCSQLKSLVPIAIVFVALNTSLSAQQLLVSAAISLSHALPSIAERFEKLHPGTRVKFNFASSGTLMHQIEHGAPVDVFISAARSQMDALDRSGLIESATRRDIASSELVLIAPPGSPLKSWRELTDEAVRRIAIGDPGNVPAGMYAKEVLTTLGMWDALRKKLVFGENVEQTLQYVESGNVEAGIVYASDLRAIRGVNIALAPTGSHEPILYPAAVVARSTHHTDARTFVEYLTTPEARAVFQENGFSFPTK